MKISSFISHALFDAASGYYRTKNPIGKNSDFITAPEISQVFGELIAAYLLQVSQSFSKKISLVEMGAGRGVLLFDILSVIKKLAEKKNPQAVDFLERSAIHIIEINPVLQKIQREKLHEFDVQWHESFEEFLRQPTTDNRQLFFISNELFDCFPIDQFVKTDVGWHERLIAPAQALPFAANFGVSSSFDSSRMSLYAASSKNELPKNFLQKRAYASATIDSNEFRLASFDPKINRFVEENLGFEASQNAPFGAVFEHSFAAKNFMTQLCEALQMQGGIAINFDYGYFKTEFANTLQALKNHQKVSIFEKPGEADITACVDFGALDKIAKNLGLNSSLITQREFLLALGIEERRQKLLEKNPQKSAEINSSIDRLIAADQMGELFKAHIIWKN